MFLSMSGPSVFLPKISHSLIALLQETARPAGRSGPTSYQMTALALVPGVCGILCAPFNSKVSTSPSPVELMQLSPTGLQKQML